MPACLALDILIHRVLTDPQVVGGERKQPEMIVMGSMAPRRAWPAVARSPKIIECLCRSCGHALPSVPDPYLKPAAHRSIQDNVDSIWAQPRPWECSNSG